MKVASRPEAPSTGDGLRAILGTRFERVEGDVRRRGVHANGLGPRKVLACRASYEE